ncbi:hypothetical protein C900_01237 [Fulvivirga imtechensis AK7]|uniref:Uncharacterized protein n=1 Tax=Fulvivirga imtechensis AK7 TaxID=1237149 RepID=L8JWI2_9BACT|nr:hypothetical protein [Fulvivirga imtechensis]ELR72563.1 hypothetical protein C900_01237 [Fulvivirga imtechensis AK7]
MNTNILGSTTNGGISLGNGSSGGNIAVKFPLLDFARPLWVSDFNIEPPRVKIEPSIKEIVERISKKLVDKPLRYKSRQLKEWKLRDIMKEDDKKGDAKAKLIRDGYSATIAQVSESLNRSNIDHTTKFLLSNEPLYVYALSFVIYYEKVKDADGVNDRVIVVAENEIKPFFNVLLAKATIEHRHLNLTAAQRKEIYKAAANTNISYVKGMPNSAISGIISKYVDHGNIHRLVDKFFESGEIDPAKGTPQVRQLMVNFLKEIGLIVPERDEEGEIVAGINFNDVEIEEEHEHVLDSDTDDDIDLRDPMS